MFVWRPRAVNCCRIAILSGCLLLGDVDGIGTALIIGDVFRSFPADLTRKAGLDGLSALEFQNEVGRLVSVSGRSKDLVLIVLERSNPRGDVCGVLFGTVRNPPLGGEEDAREFGPQFLLGVVLVAKRIAIVQCLAIQTVGVASPVGQFVKSRPIVVCRAFERFLWGKVDRVLRPAVKGSIVLVVADARTRIAQDLFAGLGHLPLVTLLGDVIRHSFDLPGVEDRVDTTNNSATAVFVGPGLGAGIQFLTRAGVGLAGTVLELPVFDVGALLALADLATVFLCLPVCKPSRIVVSLAYRRCHEL